MRSRVPHEPQEQEAGSEHQWMELAVSGVGKDVDVADEAGGEIKITGIREVRGIGHGVHISSHIS